MEEDEVGVGDVVAGEQSLLSEPLAIVAAEDGLERFTVGGENTRRDAEIRELFRRILVEIGVGCDRSAHAVTTKDNYLFELGIIDALSWQQGGADKR